MIHSTSSTGQSSRMPPFGLYPVARHHLYGGRTKPRVYSTKDFQDDHSPPASKEVAVGSHPANGGATHSKRVIAEKEKKRQSTSDKNAELERLLDRAEAMVNKEGQTTKKKKDKKNHSCTEQGVDGATGASGDIPLLPSTHEVDKTGVDQDRRAHRKRKRQREAYAAKARSVNEEYLAGRHLLENLLQHGSSQPKHPQQKSPTVERPIRKRTKRKSQSNQQEGAEQMHQSVMQSERSTIQQANHKSETSALTSFEAATEVPLQVPHDWIDGSDELKVKMHKKSQGNIALAGNDGSHSQDTRSTSKRTPIPLPRISSSFTPDNYTYGNAGAFSPEPTNVLVPETPPSRASKKTPVPLPQNIKGRDDTVATKSGRSRYRQTVLVSSPTPHVNVSAPSTAPAALESAHVASILPSVPNALTDANLQRFKKPMKEASKTRPRKKAGASTTTSVRTSSASMSILEAFARAGKPFVHSTADNDLFSVTNDKPNSSDESHEGVLMDAFTDKYRELTKTVNFEEAEVYLEEHLEWYSNNNDGPAPCLNKMTGCSAKKEELLRLSRQDGLENLAQLDTHEDDLAQLEAACNQAQRAEDLLMLATRARMPVPIGYTEGTWTLYCPKYAKNHFDRYGYGQRTLVISCIAGFRNKNTFTARMQLPPRTMAFSILSFQTPPHASFRPITIKTASEGYTMDIIFLGNGFLHLRADLGRLLTGATRKPHEGNYVMEFIGVHENATQWWSVKNDEDKQGEDRSMVANHIGHEMDW